MSLTRRIGLGAAATLGLGAAFAGSPYRHRRGQLDIASAVRAIKDGSDHVSALQLAAWIRDRKPGLRVVDVRTPAEFTEFAIPTAENIPFDQLFDASFSTTETLVLISEGGAHAGQAWVLLRAMGIYNAVFVPGGLADWHEEVLSPVLDPATAPRQSELSRYFGGQPRLATGGDTPAPHTYTRRRGC